MLRREPDVRKLSVDQLVSRIKGEYVEMPGLWLTRDQAARLWSLERSQCEELLLTLVEQGFLTSRDDGKYGRVTGDSTGGGRAGLTAAQDRNFIK
jgi:hypothetical protein